VSDPVDYQFLFNLLAALVTGIGGWLLKILRDDQKDVKERLDKHIEVQRQHEKDVTNIYLRKDDFNAVVTRLYDQLDRIEMAVAGKVDKK